MLIEHSFVTTMPCDQAVESARRVAVSYGFEMENQSDGQLVAIRKKVRSRGLAGSIMDLPARLQLSFDRGRIDLALSTETVKRAIQSQREFLIGLATIIEQALTAPHSDSLSAAIDDIAELEDEIRAKDKRSSRYVGIGCLAVIVLVAIVIGMVVTLSR